MVVVAELQVRVRGPSAHTRVTRVSPHARASAHVCCVAQRVWRSFERLRVLFQRSVFLCLCEWRTRLCDLPDMPPMVLVGYDAERALRTREQLSTSHNPCARVHLTQRCLARIDLISLIDSPHPVA